MFLMAFSNIITSNAIHLKPATHLVILDADRGEFDPASENRLQFSPPINADTLGDFFRRSRRCGSLEKSCDEIAQPDG